MATLKFNMADPETKAAVAGWAPNTEYAVTTTDDPASGIVEEVVNEPEGEAAGAAEAGATAPGPAAVKAAMAG